MSRPTDDDLHAWHVLGPLMVGFPYLPYTYMAARPQCLVQLLNDVVINDRRHVIEFGTGISTLLLGRLIMTNSLDATVKSIDHDRGWVEQLRTALAVEGLTECVELIHAPLVECGISGAKSEWYDEGVLQRGLGDAEFDLVFVDGPPAYSQQFSRYPALPFVLDRLAPSCSIFLDDADRGGEQAVITQWQGISSFLFQRSNAQDFAVATRESPRVTRLL